jgi:hypothetical protein
MPSIGRSSLPPALLQVPIPMRTTRLSAATAITVGLLTLSTLTVAPRAAAQEIFKNPAETFLGIRASVAGALPAVNAGALGQLAGNSLGLSGAFGDEANASGYREVTGALALTASADRFGGTFRVRAGGLRRRITAGPGAPSTYAVEMGSLDFGRALYQTGTDQGTQVTAGVSAGIGAALHRADSIFTQRALGLTGELALPVALHLRAGDEVVVSPYLSPALYAVRLDVTGGNLTSGLRAAAAAGVRVALPRSNAVDLSLHRVFVSTTDAVFGDRMVLGFSFSHSFGRSTPKDSDE